MIEQLKTLEPGTYFVGDLGFVLPPNATRKLFYDVLHNNGVQKGYRALGSTDGGDWGSYEEQIYWLTPTPSQAGTFFDQTGKAYSFDWFVFGCMRFNNVKNDACYDDNKVEFTEPFTCSSTYDTITIGHLHFTLNSLSK